MSDEILCAVCDDAPATDRYDGSGVLAELLATQPELNATKREIQVPLCRTCYDELEGLMNEYRNARGPARNRAFEWQFHQYVSELNIDSVAAVSE